MECTKLPLEHNVRMQLKMHRARADWKEAVVVIIDGRKATYIAERVEELKETG